MSPIRFQLDLLFVVLMLFTVFIFTIHAAHDQADRRSAMIEALSADRPDSSLGDQANAFDRLVGSWNCDYSFHLEDGTVRHDSGELLFGWILQGHAIQDIWASDPKDGKERSIGTSIRFIDPKSKHWRVIFLNPRYSGILTVEGGVEGNRIILRGVDHKGVKLRWSFLNIQPDSFVWHGETSHDGGKTWRLEEEHHMFRRTHSSADMIRALRSAGPNPSIHSHSQLFDRFVGTWDLDSTFTAADGKTTGFHGAWIFGWVLDGLVIQDVLVERKQDLSRTLGTTVRFFDAEIGEWRVIWIPPSSGDVIELKGGAVGDRIVLLGKDVDGSELRWSFNDIHSNSFVWRGEISTDGGKTWRTEQVMHLKRRT